MNPKRNIQKKRFSISGLILIGITFCIFIGFLRIYYGGNIGLRIIAKQSFSFKDTIVNLDDLLGQPRIVIASQHPAVKRQLEDMGIIETDEQVQERIRIEIERETQKVMQEYKREIERIQRQF